MAMSRTKQQGHVHAEAVASVCAACRVSHATVRQLVPVHRTASRCRQRLTTARASPAADRFVLEPAHLQVPAHLQQRSTDNTLPIMLVCVTFWFVSAGISSLIGFVLGLTGSSRFKRQKSPSSSAASWSPDWAGGVMDDITRLPLPTELAADMYNGPPLPEGEGEEAAVYLPMHAVQVVNLGHREAGLSMGKLEGPLKIVAKLQVAEVEMEEDPLSGQGSSSSSGGSGGGGGGVEGGYMGGNGRGGSMKNGRRGMNRGGPNGRRPQ